MNAPTCITSKHRIPHALHSEQMKQQLIEEIVCAWFKLKANLILIRSLSLSKLHLFLFDLCKETTYVGGKKKKKKHLLALLIVINPCTPHLSPYFYYLLSKQECACLSTYWTLYSCENLFTPKPFRYFNPEQTVFCVLLLMNLPFCYLLAKQHPSPHARNFTSILLYLKLLC